MTPDQIAYLDTLPQPTAEEQELWAKKLENDDLLWEGAAENNITKIAFAVRWGSRFQQKDQNGQTVLYSAIRAGHVEATRTLIELGASIWSFDDYGRSARRYAEHLLVMREAPERYQPIIHLIKSYCTIKKDIAPQIPRFVIEQEIRALQVLIHKDWSINSLETQIGRIVIAIWLAHHTRLSDPLLDLTWHEDHYYAFKDTEARYFTYHPDVDPIQFVYDNKSNTDSIIDPFLKSVESKSYYVRDYCKQLIDMLKRLLQQLPHEIKDGFAERLDIILARFILAKDVYRKFYQYKDADPTKAMEAAIVVGKIAVLVSQANHSKQAKPEFYEYKWSDREYFYFAYCHGVDPYQVFCNNDAAALTQMVDKYWNANKINADYTKNFFKTLDKAAAVHLKKLPYEIGSDALIDFKRVFHLTGDNAPKPAPAPAPLVDALTQVQATLADLNLNNAPNHEHDLLQAQKQLTKTFEMKNLNIQADDPKPTADEKSWAAKGIKKMNCLLF